jgi:hypothetical protein
VDGGAELLLRSLAATRSAAAASDLVVAYLSGARLEERSAKQLIESLPTEHRAAVGTREAIAPDGTLGEAATGTLMVAVLTAMEASGPTPELRFNRALALEKAGRVSEARAAWQHIVQSESEGGWRAEARRHLEALPGS